MKTLKLTVTKECIINGIEMSPTSCPIAKALKAAGYKNPMVLSGTEISARKNGRRVHFKDASGKGRVSEFINYFDAKDSFFTIKSPRKAVFTLVEV